MDHPAGAIAARAEDLLRILASAMSAVRLYPPASPLRTEAIARFITAAQDMTRVTGPLQYRIDRNRFIIGDVAIGENLPQVSALAETLHALQVAQMIVAPDLTADEVVRFLDTIGSDSIAVRASGGIRKALTDVAVANIAVVEVTLRASTEAGLLGLDLTTSPLEEIAPELADAAAAWLSEAQSGGNPTDAVAEAIERLEPAARDLAMNRCAEALRHLDEKTRLSLLDAALTSAPSGAMMSGMLDVVSHVPPAALARLLRMTSEMRGSAPDSIMAGLELPESVMSEVLALLSPSPQSDEQRGIPAEVDVSGIAVEVAGTDEDDIAYLDRLVAGTTQRDAAARGMATATRIARLTRSQDAIKAVTEALPAAIASGTLPEIAHAATVLRELSDEPALAPMVQTALRSFADADLAKECVRQLSLDPSSGAARTLLETTGSEGAEALLAAYIDGDQPTRARLATIAEPLSETIAPAAGRIARSGDPAAAIAVTGMLEAMHARRLVPTIALGLEHLDARVRESAIRAIARIPGQESARLLEKCLGHWDPETRRIAAREIGAARIEESVPALIKVIAIVEVNERNYELKKEILKSLEILGSERAIPTLERLASRRVVFGKKNRELRYLARRVLDSIRARDRSDRRRDSA